MEEKSLNPEQRELFLRTESLREALEKLKVNDHLCLIYERKEEWQEAVITFLLLGIKRGEKCIYITDSHKAYEIRNYLQKEGIDVKKIESSGQLIIISSTNAYTRGGYFDPDRMISLLIKETRKAIDEGYPALRATGEMTWVLRGVSGSKRIIEYEAKLNRDFFPKYPCLAICQYERKRFDPQLIKGIIMAHPLLIWGNRVYDNFYYIPPEDFLSQKESEQEVQHMLNNINQERIYRILVQEGEQNYRTLFENTLDGLFVLDAETMKVVLANRALANMYGFSSPEDIIGKNPLDFIAPEQKEKALKIIKEDMFKHDLRQVNQFKTETLDGRTIWVETLGVRINYQGRLSGLISIRDITERKIAEERLQETLFKLRKLLGGVINVISLIVEKRDPYTAGHQKKVSDLARAIADEMELPKEKVEAIRTAALLHDIGKIQIPAEILTKPTRLNNVELSLVKAHPQVACEIIKDIEFPWNIADIILQHHERLDGSGYPQGLKDDEILLEARILAVADVVEAMSSHRPYRQALGTEKALKEIEKNKGKLYDPQVVDACLRLFREKGFKF